MPYSPHSTKEERYHGCIRTLQTVENAVPTATYTAAPGTTLRDVRRWPRPWDLKRTGPPAGTAGGNAGGRVHRGGGEGRSPGSEVGLGLSLAVLPRAGRVSPLPSASSSVLGKHELMRARAL